MEITSYNIDKLKILDVMMKDAIKNKFFFNYGKIWLDLYLCFDDKKVLYYIIEMKCRNHRDIIKELSRYLEAQGIEDIETRRTSLICSDKSLTNLVSIYKLKGMIA